MREMELAKNVFGNEFLKTGKLKLKETCNLYFCVTPKNNRLMFVCLVNQKHCHKKSNCVFLQFR